MVGVCTGSSVVLPVSVDGRRGDSRAGSWPYVCLYRGTGVFLWLDTSGCCVLGFSLQCPVLHSTSDVHSQAQGAKEAVSEPAKLGNLLFQFFSLGWEHLSICVHLEMLSWMHLAARLEQIFTGVESSLCSGQHGMIPTLCPSKQPHLGR